jgi:hypothetical protein
MHEAGIFNDDDRLDLINGEVKTMFSIGRKHIITVIIDNYFSVKLLFFDTADTKRSLLITNSEGRS